MSESGFGFGFGRNW